MRIKAFLAVRRNQTRDYLDIAALAYTIGTDQAANILAGIDNYYADQHGTGVGVRSQVVRQLSDPRPKDSLVTGNLNLYKRLNCRWHDWNEVVAVCNEVADIMEGAL